MSILLLLLQKLYIKVKKFVILVFLFSSSFQSYGQFIIEPDKPQPSAEMPGWAKLLYQNPINMIQLDDAYQNYYKTHAFEKNNYTRYYKRLIRLNQDLIDEQGFLKERTIEPAESNLGIANRQGNAWKAYTSMETFFLERNQEACPWQTNVYKLSVCKNKPEVLIAGTETGALFISKDKAKTWNQIALNTSISPEAICIDPIDPDIIYSAPNGFVRKSTDGGKTWRDVYQKANFEFYEISIHPANSSIILAGGDDGLIRSTNGGLDWTTITTDKVCDIKFSPINESHVFILRYNLTAARYEVWKSTDGGQTFVIKNKFWHNLKDGGARLALTAADENRVYVIVLTTTEGPYLMRSNDAGENWVIQAKGSYSGYSSKEFPMDNWQGYYDLAIMASQKNADQVITGTGSTFRSIDGGKTFKLIGGYGGAIPLHPDLQSCASVGSDSYVATDGGITYSTDFFDDPKNAVARNFGLYGTDFWGFDIGWNEKIMVGGRYHNGNTVYHENYNGKFIRMGGAESPTGYVNPIENRQTFFSDIGAYQMPFKYDTSWKYFNIPSSVWPNESYYQMHGSRMVWSPVCYSTVYLGYVHILYKSVNNGASYQEIFRLPNTNEQLETIEISRSNPSVIYISTRNNPQGEGLMYKSTDGGQHFTMMPNPPGTTGGQRRVNTIVVSPDDENVVYRFFRTGNASNKVFKSIDGGNTWTNLTTATISNFNINSVCYQYGTDGGIYIACDGGKVFYRNNQNSDWVNYSDGLCINHVGRLLRPFYRDGILISGSNMGIWEIPLIEKSKPLAQPSVNKQVSECVRDTFYFGDYSVLELDSLTSWSWQISGAQYVSDTTKQSVKAVFGKPGKYSVTLTVKNSQGINSKTVLDMVEVKENTCKIDSFTNKTLDLSSRGDYGTIPPIPALKDAKGFSCMAWINLKGKQDCFTQILSNWNSNVGFGFGFAFQGYVQTRNLTFFWKGVPYQLTSPFNLDTLQWIHVALTVYQDSVRLYRNGEYWTYKGNFSGFDFSSTPWVIGQGVPGQCGDFYGQMEDLKIYNRTLSQEEIQQNMHLIRPEGENGLVAYYQFNESKNTFAYDRVGLSHCALSNAKLIPSTAPLGPGSSQKIQLQNGENSFDKTGLKVNTSSNSTANRNWWSYQIVNSADSFPNSSGMFPNKYWIIRTFDSKAKQECSSLKLKNPGIKLADYYYFPKYIRLYQRDSANSYLNKWQLIGVATEIDLSKDEISFGSLNDLEGQLAIEVLPNPSVNTDNQIQQRDLSLYPNPAQDQLIITYTANRANEWLILYDVTGREWKRVSTRAPFQFALDISDISSGVYLLKYSNEVVYFIKK